MPAKANAEVTTENGFERRINPDTLLHGLEVWYESDFIRDLRRAMRKYPNVDFSDMLSEGQIRSKRWLVNELINVGRPVGTAFLCAGWYASLASMMFEEARALGITKIRSFDKDPSCQDVADTLNRTYLIKNWMFKAATYDILYLNYQRCFYDTYRVNGTVATMEDSPDTIINTSCEHLSPSDYQAWLKMIPPGKLVVLQSNNFVTGADHVNCVRSSLEFNDATPNLNVLYRGMLSLENYDRYMLIGVSL